MFLTVLAGDTVTQQIELYQNVLTVPLVGWDQLATILVYMVIPKKASVSAIHASPEAVVRVNVPDLGSV